MVKIYLHGFSLKLGSCCIIALKFEKWWLYRLLGFNFCLQICFCFCTPLLLCQMSLLKHNIELLEILLVLSSSTSPKHTLKIFILQIKKLTGCYSHKRTLLAATLDCFSIYRRLTKDTFFPNYITATYYVPDGSLLLNADLKCSI